jgi:hypothetical protein
MSEREYSKHQKRIIKNYYRNRDGMALQKLQDLVTELYLAESEKKAGQLWKRVEKALDHLEISTELRAHILESRRPEVLAANLQDWWSSPLKAKADSPPPRPLE